MADDKTYLAYVNGSYVDRDHAVVSAFDRGLLYGDGIFETMRSYEGAIFRLHEHMERLSASAAELRLPLPVPAREIARIANDLITRNGLLNAYVRVTLTRGQHTGSLVLDTDQLATLVIDCRPVVPYPAEWYERGIALGIAKPRRGRSLIAPRHKSLSYMENLLILDDARGAGMQEALVLTDDGCVCECATANVFWSYERHICTPATDTNLLNGVTRATVIELCRRIGLDVTEAQFTIEQLYAADEAFITNSIMEVMPVREVGGRGMKQCPGEMTAELIKEYSREVERCAARFRTDRS